MTTRKINRLIIKKDDKVYSFRCLAASGAITLRDSDFVYIAFVADLLTNSEIIILGHTSLGRTGDVLLRPFKTSYSIVLHLQRFG